MRTSSSTRTRSATISPSLLICGDHEPGRTSRSIGRNPARNQNPLAAPAAPTATSSMTTRTEPE